MAVRIHFTAQDLMRVRLRSQPSPIREALSSVTLLRLPVNRQGLRAGWVREVRPRLRPGMRPFLDVQPGRLAPTFDFISRTETRRSMPEVLDAVRATPRRTVERDVAALSVVRRLPSWVHRLAERDGSILGELTLAVGAYFDAALAPGWEAILQQVAGDYAVRLRTLADHGIDGLFQSLAPVFQWRPPVLHWDMNHESLPPVEETLDIHLAGRGLTLVPTMFWSGLALDDLDPSRPVIITYPVPGATLGTARDDGVRGAALAGLMGRTRAAVLEASVTGCSTTELARLLGISPGSASEHATSLRLAGLITSHRQGNTVRHHITPLGHSLRGRAG